MRANRTIPFLIVAVSVLAGFAVMLSSVLAGTSVRSQSHSSAMASSESMPDDMMHILHGGFWRTDGGFLSTIRIKNVLVVAPIQVTPTLFMADGTAYPLPALTVPISGVATVNINDALASTPEAIAAHISEFGSLTLVYGYPTPGHVVASVSAIDAPRSLSFVYMIDEPMPMPEDNTLNVLEGLWWKHDRGVHGAVSLSNTTDQPRTAMLRATGPDRDSDEREVELAPHATQVLTLEEFSREASDADNRAGGVRVEYTGPQGAIMVSGNLANESEGYSANMPFGSHDPNSQAAKISLASAGIMVGKPDPMMMPGFPADTKFAPYLALRNTTTKPLDVALQLNYIVDVKNGSPINRKLPAQRLRPYESRKVDLERMFHAAGLRSFNGSVNLLISYTGQRGDLILATGSVDQTGTYVFEGSVEGIGESIGTISGYWSVANGNDTMFSLWNPTDSPQDVMATLYYGDGSSQYRLPIHLAPQGSTMLDVAMLKMEMTQDAAGKVIPPNVFEGSASFDSVGHDSSAPDGRQRMTLIIAGAFYNVATATCGVQWIYCDGYSNFTLNPSSATIAVGNSQQFTAQATDSYGHPQTLSTGTWSTSDNGSISTVSSGNVTGVAAGGTSVIVRFQSIMVYQGNYCVPDSQQLICPTANTGASATVTVTPRIDSISPSRGLIGATTSSVTIAGKGFTTGGHVNTPAAIQVSNITTFTDTQIVLDLVVSSSATTGNNAGAISVTASNQTSNAKDFFVQVPASLAKAGTATGTSEGLCPGGTACGTIVSFPYQVFDQDSPPQPIRAAMSMWDTFASTFSPDNLQLQGTASFTTCPGNTGPCGVFTGSDGTFTEGALGACSPVCKVNGVCTTGGPSGIDQTWHIAGQPIVQHILDYCEKVVVNGSQIQ